MQGAGTAIGELPPYFMARAGIISIYQTRYTCTCTLYLCPIFVVLLDFYFSMSERLKLELAFSSFVLKKKKIMFLQAQVVHVSQTFSTAFKKA